MSETAEKNAIQNNAIQNNAIQYNTIDYRLEDGLAEITLNRPEKMNAMTSEMRLELASALNRAHGGVLCSDKVLGPRDAPRAITGEARAILITGAGEGFCAGQDLGDVTKSELEMTLREEYAPMLRAVALSPIPTVCAVNGVAAGAGAHVAMSADIVVAGRSARFVEPFARIALMPAGAGSYWLPRLVGHARARGMTMLSEPVSAETAERWGLIWSVVDDDALATEARRIARKLATGPTTAFCLAKQALTASMGNDFETQIDLEARLQGEAGRTRDYLEGVAAFLEKRKPRFEGR